MFLPLSWWVSTVKTAESALLDMDGCSQIETIQLGRHSEAELSSPQPPEIPEDKLERKGV